MSREPMTHQRVGRDPDEASLVMMEVSQAWEDRLRRLLDGRFRRYVRVLHGPPSRDRVGGKLPLVAVQLLEIHLSEGAQVGRRHKEHRGTQASGPPRGSGLRGLRLDYLFSAWAEEPLDEQLLLDVIRVDLDMERRLLVTPVSAPCHAYPVTPRPCLKVDQAVSLWSAMGWPVHASLTYGVTIKAQ